VDIANNGIESLTGNSVVAAGTELASKTSVHDGLAGNLSGNSDAKDHPGKLEAPSQQIQVSNRKDKGDGGGVGNSRGTWAGMLVSGFRSWNHGIPIKSR
jgi:hypothetical protein